METIDVRQLGPRPTGFHWNEAPAALGLKADPEFQFPISIDLEATRAGARVVVEGKVRSRVVVECSRCLEPAEKEMEAAVGIVFLEGPAPQDKNEHAAEDDGKDVSYYTAPFIDLSDDLRQILLVATPAYPVCRDDCRGLCPECGRNRNRAGCECRPPAKDRPFEALGSMLEKEQ